MILPDNEVVVTMDRNEATARHLPTGITASFGSHHWAHDNQKTAREKLGEKVGRHYFDQMLQPWLRHEDTKYADDRYLVIAMPTKEQAEAMVVAYMQMVGPIIRFRCENEELSDSLAILTAVALKWVPWQWRWCAQRDGSYEADWCEGAGQYDKAREKYKVPK